MLDSSKKYSIGIFEKLVQITLANGLIIFISDFIVSNFSFPPIKSILFRIILSAEMIWFEKTSSWIFYVKFNNDIWKDI